MSSMSPTSPSLRRAPWCGHAASTAKTRPPKRKRAMALPCTSLWTPGPFRICRSASVCAARAARLSGSLGNRAKVLRCRSAAPTASAAGVGASLTCLPRTRCRWCSWAAAANSPAPAMADSEGSTAMPPSPITICKGEGVPEYRCKRLDCLTSPCATFNASRNRVCHSSPSGISYALTPLSHQKTPVDSSHVCARRTYGCPDSVLGTRDGRRPTRSQSTALGARTAVARPTACKCRTSSWPRARS
mmetsp:Transcript_43407/g.122718  ORF Transcript_43407/g.122718 Transcript_43407/m.122718 type:complete len:245 (-) Transcript_43407:239-973(-)